MHFHGKGWSYQALRKFLNRCIGVGELPICASNLYLVTFFVGTTTSPVLRHYIRLIECHTGRWGTCPGNNAQQLFAHSWQLVCSHFLNYRPNFSCNHISFKYVAVFNLATFVFNRCLRTGTGCHLTGQYVAVFVPLRFQDQFGYAIMCVIFCHLRGMA